MTAVSGELRWPTRSLEETLSDLKRRLRSTTEYDPKRRRLVRMIADLEAEVEFRTTGALCGVKTFDRTSQD